MSEHYMKTGERQVSKTVEGVRRDHVARYDWAAEKLNGFKSVIDMCCGIGYGSKILAESGLIVSAMDIDNEAIEFARENFNHPRVVFSQHDVSKLSITSADAVVAFECIEHIKDPRQMLKTAAGIAPVLLASVPNEDVFPWLNYKFHHRHYTKGQFEALLNECGWLVEEWYGQEGAESEVEPDVKGRTLIAKCIRGNPTKKAIDTEIVKPEKIKHVSIVGLGVSMLDYINITKRLGGRHRYCDETWAINALGDVIQCDKIFHMDDVRIQEIRAEASPGSNIASMLEWLKTTDIPVITSRAHEDYPTTVAFPLAEVLTNFDTGYFNSTAAYAVAYAIWLGVEKISLFGMDYTYPDAHDAEKGRACVEYWLGMASERGIKLSIPKTSTLLDALHTKKERFYGYDTLDLHITQDENGVIDIEFAECAELPTAEEIEAAYNHEKHPNPLVK